MKNEQNFRVIEIRLLTEKEIPQVVQLSASIFTPIVKELGNDEKPELWDEQFRENGLLLGAYVDKQLAGYAFFFEKEKDSGAAHCWMTGVLEKYRGQGVLSQLMDEGQKQLQEKGYKQITVNTFEEKFPNMYAYLLKHGFTLYKEEQKEWQGKSVTKSFFKKQLN